MSKKLSSTCPQTHTQVVDQYFIEHRAKLIDVAAYLDRVDRAADAATIHASKIDFRHDAFRQAILLLTSDQPQRTKRILELFSVTDSEQPQSAQGMKGASGAVPLPANATRERGAAKMGDRP